MEPLALAVSRFGSEHFGSANFANGFLAPVAARMAVRWKQASRELRLAAGWLPPAARHWRTLLATMLAMRAVWRPEGGPELSGESPPPQADAAQPPKRA
jgi:hypothetical protein